MFYSQFILAKKGPLGTIWIAAHLERKLRKNQVADTDIGVSVDSILSPDVPIALRLSSHLLLGVVRIYSRKVNYLFDDCSDALLKVKQAFRSTAVDLPPEESKAPYHSITLPETFDLDDFELPDTEVFHGNFVDHHVSAKEQITLQDTMDGVVYSTSQFGLDERFADEDASQIALDLDEELLLNKGPSGHGVLLTSRPDPEEPSSSQKDVEIDEDMHDTYEEDVGSPFTTQPMEPVIDPSTDQNPEFDENKSLDNSEEYGKAPEIELKDTTVSSNSSEQADHQHDKSTVNCSPSEKPFFVDESITEPAIEAEGKLDIDLNPDNKDDAKTDMLSVCKPLLQPCTFPNDQQNGGLENLASLPKDLDALEVSVAKVLDSPVEAEGVLDINLNAENREGQDLVTPEASEVARVEAAISNNQESVELDNLVSVPKDFDFGIGSNEISGIPDAREVSVAQVQDFTNRDLNEDRFLHTDLFNSLAGQPVTTSEDIPSQKEDNPVASELPSPEKMLSLPDLPVNQSNELFVQTTPERQVLAHGDIMNKMSGKKRSLTESTITLQSQNSLDTSEAAQSKRSVDFVPDDNDLLSSILVGRRSTVLKVKSTPPPSELVSYKRPRVTRPATNKRKVLVDESMVLHGDTIRQQLVSTEEIRRVRKKAPSTQPEILILQRLSLGEEMFNEPIFTGLSTKLVSLHYRPYDLSETELVEDVGNKAQCTENETILSLKDSEFEGVSTVGRDEAVSALDTPIEQSMRDFSNLYGNEPETETMTNNEAGETTLQFDISENRSEMETECRSEPITLTNSEAVHTENETMNNSVLGNSPLQFEIPENRTETSSCLPCASEKNADTVMDICNADLSEQGDVSCLKLDEQSNGKDAILTVDTAVQGIEFGEGEKQSCFEIRQEDAESVEPMGGAQPECSLPVNDENIFGEDKRFDEDIMHELETVNNDLKYEEQRDDSRLDPVGDVFDHDTDFLNFDDDDDDEIPEDDQHSTPNAGAQVLDNTGWSTRTRAVANYLQVLFHKEAQHGRTVLRLDNLLANKTRKEASRMFFETLVLKTRDYIHVDEEVPFGNINIKPRARLLNSEF